MNTEKVISRDGDYILHTYGRSQVVLAEGKGMTARLSLIHISEPTRPY